ncbi:unnamed protein product, partial [Polarella glacialis]
VEGFQRIPIADLPPMPYRGTGYRTEPIMGICVVGVLCAILVAVTQGVTNGPDAEATQLGQIAVILIWAEASIAILSTLYLLFGDAGVIKRTEESCYPIPSEVEQRIRALQSLDSLKNIPGPQGDIRHGSYCVRCLVWRSKD